ncbi:SDR family oxidoreductase [Psychromicrobium sp. YIM B11713]|uniref:SDR family oxidoreductase n=1 Tax=Psychromicrobium sp. YIM B11713 TaxID=3145233 RepID=UPI00374EF874
MRVFVTGASGWIGSATVDDLLNAGHQVVGLVRSETAAAELQAKHAEVLFGNLDDLETLRRGAAESDGVIHLANKHDWNDPAESNRAERAAVEAIAETLVGSDRPFVLASGLFQPDHEGLTLETDNHPESGPGSLRGGSENLALDYVTRGVRSIAARFAPTVHGLGDHGFIALITAAARRHGVSCYIGDGSAEWAAVHRTDAARLIRLGLEQAPAGTRLHAVAEQGIRSRTIAETIGEAFDLPVTSISPDDAVEHFGFLGRLFGTQMRASNAQTRASFSWNPTGPTLAEDILNGAYAEA